MIEFDRDFAELAEKKKGRGHWGQDRMSWHGGKTLT